MEGPFGMAILVGSESKIVVHLASGGDLSAPPQPLPLLASNLVAHVRTGDPDASVVDHLLFDGLPAFETLFAAVSETGANVSLVVGDPAAAEIAVNAAIEAKIPLVLLAVSGMTDIQRARIDLLAAGSDIRILGPGMPEIVTPGACHIGSMPAYICSRGQVGILADSATFAQQATLQTPALGLGQSTVVGFESGRPSSQAYLGCLDALLADPETKGIVLSLDHHAGCLDALAHHLAECAATKPIMLHLARDGRRMANESPSNAVSIARGRHMRLDERLRDIGVIVTESPARVGRMMKSALEREDQKALGSRRLADFASAMRQVEFEIYQTD